MLMTLFFGEGVAAGAPAADPTQLAKGRTGDRPGPRKETTTRRNVTQGVAYSGAPSVTRSHAPCRLHARPSSERLHVPTSHTFTAVQSTLQLLMRGPEQCIEGHFGGLQAHSAALRGTPHHRLVRLEAPGDVAESMSFTYTTTEGAAPKFRLDVVPVRVILLYRFVTELRSAKCRQSRTPPSPCPRPRPACGWCPPAVVLAPVFLLPFTHPLSGGPVLLRPPLSTRPPLPLAVFSLPLSPPLTPPPLWLLEAPVRKIILQRHTPARTSPCWSRQTPAWTRSVHLDAPGQRHGQQPVSGTADPRSSQTGQVIRGLC